MRRSTFVLALACALLSCGVPEGASAPPPDVVATTPIVGAIVKQVVGGAASVEVVMPSGGDPHSFSPSARQVAELTQARLVVANGFGYEEGLRDALELASDEGTDVFELASTFEARTGPEGPDPHIWFDPVQMADAIEELGVELARALGGHEDWSGSARAYAEEVRAAHTRVERILSEIPQSERRLVTLHESLGYFAARYGFELVGAAVPGPSSTAGSSAAQIAELARAIELERVPAVFAESGAPASLLEIVAAEVSGPVAVVPLLTESPAPAGADGDRYPEMLEVDARRIAAALG